MMRAHIIENGFVINTIVIEDINMMPNLIEATDGGIGWKYENDKFIEPEQPNLVIQQVPTKEELIAKLENLQMQINQLSLQAEQK